MALGGSHCYEGRDLAAATVAGGSAITMLDLVACHLAAVLASLGVSPELNDEVVEAVDGLRDEVLGLERSSAWHAHRQ